MILSCILVRNLFAYLNGRKESMQRGESKTPSESINTDVKSDLDRNLYCKQCTPRTPLENMSSTAFECIGYSKYSQYYHQSFPLEQLDFVCLRPKKNTSFPVTRPTLFFGAKLKYFFYFFYIEYIRNIFSSIFFFFYKNRIFYFKICFI